MDIEKADSEPVIIWQQPAHYVAVISNTLCKLSKELIASQQKQRDDLRGKEREKEKEHS